MVSTYKEAREYIHSRLTFGIKPGLERMNWCLNELRNPHRRSKYVHIAGTNGKGSVVSFLRYALQAGGNSVGTFTSPFIYNFNERISINGTPISNDEMVELVNIIAPIVERLEKETDLGELTEFETITLMAFVYFGRVNPVDIVLLEVGLGGTYDSTNVISPLVSVITSIGKDHMNVLGNTIGEIAAQKAGVMKSGVALVTGVEDPELIHMFDEIAVAKRTKVYALGREFNSLQASHKGLGETFQYKGIFESNNQTYDISMTGAHQVRNATVALAVLELLNSYYGYHIEPEKRKLAFAEMFWPGRFEQISTDPIIIMDGAHNVDGMKSLVATIKNKYPNYKINMLLAMIENKEHKEIVELAENVVDEMYYTEFDFPNALSKENLSKLATKEPKNLVADWKQFLEEYRRSKHDKEVLVVAGSLYFISEISKQK